MSKEDGSGAEVGEAFREALREDIEDVFGTDVRVRMYEQRGRLDVHVTPSRVKAHLEDRHDDITVTPYTDFKLTVGFSDSQR